MNNRGKRKRKKSRGQAGSVRPTSPPTAATTAERPADGQPEARRGLLSVEFRTQFQTAAIATIVGLALGALVPDRLTRIVRYGFLYAVNVTAGSLLVLVLTAIFGLVAFIAVRRRRSVTYNVIVVVAVWLLVVAGNGLVSYIHPVRGVAPTFGFFGFFRSADDGSLLPAPEFDNVASAFFDELAATKLNHPCLAKSAFAFSRYDVAPLFLALNSRSSLDRYIHRNYIDAQVGMWGFVDSSGKVQEFHFVPLIKNLFSDTAFFDRASEQLVRAINHGPSTRLAAARFGARTLGALLGYAHATILSQQSNNPDLAVECAGASAALLEGARGFLSPLPGFEDQIADHKAYWEPAFYVARAQALENAGRHDVAADVYTQAAELNPLFPYTSRSDYLSALRWTEAKGNLRSADAQEAMKELGADREAVENALDFFRSQVPQPYGPGLQKPVLVSLMEALRHTPGGPGVADGPFAAISKKWPRECLVWFHWGDWYREIMLVEAGLNAKTAPPQVLNPSLLARLKPAIARYEKALEIDANCAPARERLTEAYLFASGIDKPENKAKWLAKALAVM